MRLSGPACPSAPTHGYRRRRPERGVLYRILSEHLPTFLARADADETRAGLPRRVRRELAAYLRCGVLAHGFARVRCASCGKDALVAFSCKGRGFCPSCGGRRMAEAAAHLVDRVLPEVPVRQWVLSMPWRLRFLLASDPALCAAVRRSFLRAVFASYRARAKREGLSDGRTEGHRATPALSIGVPAGEICVHRGRNPGPGGLTAGWKGPPRVKQGS